MGSAGPGTLLLGAPPVTRGDRTWRLAAVGVEGSVHALAADWTQALRTNEQVASGVHAWLTATAHLGSRFAAQDVEPIDGALGWLRYLSKHAARGVAHYQRQGMPPGWQKTGRLYGFRGAWPFCEPEKVVLTAAGGHRFRRLLRSWRIADARAALAALPPGSSPAAVRQARRRVGSARRSLSSGNRRLSPVRGMSEWAPESVGLALLALVAAEGLTVIESPDESRARVFDEQNTGLGAALDLMAELGFVEVPEPALEGPHA